MTEVFDYIKTLYKASHFNIDDKQFNEKVNINDEQFKRFIKQNIMNNPLKYIGLSIFHVLKKDYQYNYFEIDETYKKIRFATRLNTSNDIEVLLDINNCLIEIGHKLNENDGLILPHQPKANDVLVVVDVNTNFESITSHQVYAPENVVKMIEMYNELNDYLKVL